MTMHDKRNGSEHAVASRGAEYLVAREVPEMLPQDVAPVEMSLLEESLHADSAIQLLDQIDDGSGQSVFLVSMTPEHAQELQTKFGERVIIEPNDDLDLLAETPDPWLGMEQDPGLLMESEEQSSVTITVYSASDPARPVVGATVYLMGRLWPAKGVTNNDGRASLTLLGETPETIKGLYVQPRDSYWSLWSDNPDLHAGQNNVVSLKHLSAPKSQFPEQEIYGWGHKAMRLDEVKAEYRGQGIKIAIIDSGLATAHEDLDAHGGLDLTAGSSSPDSWQQDVIRHGTHVAGVAAARHNHKGVRGFAPEAEVYAYKIFPGGKSNYLIKALDLCIENQIDIVNLSLGSKRPSKLVRRKIEEAKSKGVACIAAAGNAAGAVQYPAAFPEVLAVSAIGQRGTFPEDSYHHRQVSDHKSADERYFAGRFT